MKKVFIAVLFAALVTPLFTSCDPDEPKCYEIKYTVTTAGIETKFEIYQWMSANQLDAYIEKLKKDNGEHITITSKKVNKDYSDASSCASANIRL